MIVPLEVCSEAHELQMHTLQHHACTGTNYETLKERERDTESDRQTDRHRVRERKFFRDRDSETD